MARARKNEQQLVDELFDHLLLGLSPEARRAWEDCNTLTQAAVCARFVLALRRRGDLPSDGTPSAIKDRCLVPLLTGLKTMSAEELAHKAEGIGDMPSHASPVPVDPATEAAVAELRGRAVTMTDAELEASNLVAEVRGAARQSQFIETVSRTSVLARLARIKESKAYKGARVRTAEGGYVEVRTWEDFCSALGMSRRMVEEDLANLAAFGDNLLKMQDSLGIGYRELRKMRAHMAELPESAREEIRAEIEQAGDREELLAALDEMGARNARLSEEKKDLQERLHTNDRLLKEAREKEYATRMQMERALNPTSPDEEARAVEDQMERVRHALTMCCRNLEQAGAQVAAVMSRLNHTEDGRGWMTDEQYESLIRESNERIGQSVARVAELLLTSGADVDMAAAMRTIALAETGDDEE